MSTGFVVGDRILGLAGDSHALWSAGYGVLGPFWVLAASAIGQLHLHDGKHRDDAVQARAAGPWLAIAVADGVGTCPLSRYGASYVVDSLTTQLLREVAVSVQSDAPAAGAQPPARDWEVLASSLPQDTDQPPPASDSVRWSGSFGWWLAARQVLETPMPPLEEVLSRAFQRTHLGLAEYAKYLGVAPADISTTALALLMNTETGEGIAGQVGDGALLGLRTDGNVELLVDIEARDNLQSVHPITSENWAAHFVKAGFGPSANRLFDAHFVMSDGVADDLLYAPPDVAQKWAHQVQRLVQDSRSPAQAVTRILYSLATYKIPASFDDRTLVVITRRKQDANGELATEWPESA